MTAHPKQRSAQTLADYERRLSSHRDAASRARRAENLLSIARLIVFVVTGAIGGTLAFRPLFPAWLLIFPTLLFLALVVRHELQTKRRRRAERGAAFYERGIARIRFEPAAVPEAPDVEPEHLYADDLDVLGPGSLYERLRTARTDAGKSCLRRWLLEPAPPSVVRSRQEAVAELGGRLDLREDLAALGEESGARVDSGLLKRWAAEPARLSGRWQPWVAAGLSANTLTTLTLWLSGQWTAVPFLAAIWMAAGFALIYRRRVEEVLSTMYGPDHELGLLAVLLKRLEGERFEAPHLAALHRSIESSGRPASARIRSLQRWVVVADSRRNNAVAIFSALLFLGTHAAFALERWKADPGNRVADWIDAVGEIEALASFAAFFHEHPAATFPDLIDDPHPAKLVGANLVHPLLEGCVPNDVEFGGTQRLFLVSGSNMSGKSTWLRTIGTNVALAQAGAPICGDSLALSPLQIGAAMRIADSLQRGMSHFYAEISRFRQIFVATANDPPLLFLLDEILHGTNSHDRRIGAEGVIRALLEGNAIGLVTTHDLALAAIADELGEHAVNIHFEDHLEDGEMRFDFKVREGVVRKSNALELMRSVGLSV